MRSRVGLFEQIRRDRDREGLSIRALAERHGVHRRAVRQALASPEPPARKRPAGRPAPAEAESRRELGRVIGRYARTELVVLDELGYLALPEGARS